MRYMIGVGLVFLSFATGSVFADKPHGKQLPPGLQKKVEKGGELPPGWRKKLARGQTLDRSIYDYGVVRPVDDYYEQVYVEDKIITVIRNTLEIIDILSR